MKRFCCIDCETDGKDAKLLGVSFYSDTVQEYATSKTRIRELLYWHAHAENTFLAHNASYDVPIIFRAVNIPITIIEYNRRFNRAEWEYNSRKPLAQVWDSLGLSGGLSLDKLGKALGIPKYETPQTLQGLDPNKYNWKCDKHGTWECIECYCLRDAEIPYKFMVDFTNLLDGWGLEPKRRLAGISMDAWRFFDKPTPIYLHDSKIKQLGREAYHGGRTECFKLGHFPVAYMADICSAYPAAMLTTPMPDPEHMTYLENMNPDRINWDHEGVADVEITIPPMYVPPLPYNDIPEETRTQLQRMVRNHTMPKVIHGRRLYPIGTIRGCWPICELRYAQSLGATIGMVHRIGFSHKTVFPFSNFVGILWELRQAFESKNDPRSLLAKLIMNNLYGRIGMRDDLDVIKQYPKPPQTTIEDHPGAKLYTIEGYDYVEEQKTQRFGNKYANVVWAAQITGAVRIALHKQIMLQGSNIIYCDTDSVFSIQPIQGLGDGLGALRSPETLTNYYLMMPKTYSYIDLDGKAHYKAKGVPRKQAKEFIERGIVHFDAPIKPLEQSRRKRLAGHWVETKRTNHHLPHRRQPTKPISTLLDTEWVDTTPPIIE